MQIEINALAEAARPVDDKDWGSDRQNDAQNAFFAAVEKILNADERETLDDFCMKATTEEMIDEAITMVSANAIDRLTNEYDAWNKAQGLNLGSADEHLFDEALTEAQRKWVGDFCRRWENVSLVHGPRGRKLGRDGVVELASVEA